VPVP
jgi:ATP-dependent RNA helicase DDX6/DHH1